MNSHPEIVLPLLAGFLLDCLIGDPHWLPHPIRFFGRAISLGEKSLNKGKRRKLKGAALTIGLVLLTFFFFWFVLRTPGIAPNIRIVLISVFVFYGLANRSLIRESWKVVRVLKRDGIEAGRRQLSMIVGRDTKNLSKNQVRTAVLETLAENLSDGVIAPLFFYAIGGVPAMMAYKMANTLDSMVGYKNERYASFGFFAAKLDDVLNYIPARITAFLMVLVSCSPRGFTFIFKYGKRHASPNAGYPEAVLAGILDCRFGGPNMYHGKLVEKPYIGENCRGISDKDVIRACFVNLFSALLFVALIVLINIL